MAAPSAPLPSTIGRFQIDSRLGSGGMGEVYRAFDPKLHRTVAVKTVRSDRTGDSHLQRLCREAQAAGRLQHRNIVSVFDTGEVDGIVFIAMEYLKGDSLSTVLERESLSVQQKIDILVQVLDALEYAHGEGVIHRDIKPANIHRLPDGFIKLLDFGLARVTGADALTQTGAIMGTPHYSSPEQLSGGAMDARTDIYSTGVLAYEMFTGRRPFDGETISSVVLKVVSEPPAPMDQALRRAYPELEPIVLRAMAKSPLDRFASAAEMRKALVALRTSSHDQAAVTTVTTSAAALARRRERPWWIRPGIAAVAVLMLATIAWSFRTPAVPAQTDVAPALTAGAASLDLALRNDSADTRPAGAAAAPVQTQQRGSSASSTEPDAEEAAASDAKELFMGASRDLVLARPDPAAAERLGLANTGLRYRLLQKLATGEEILGDPDATFRSGDQVRFAFDSNVNGYLYVIQQGSSGNWTVLFPHPEINGGSNAIERRREYAVPENGWFMFDDNPGVERLFVFLSTEPVRQLPGFDRPLGAPETVSPMIVEELGRTVRARDLVFQKDKPASGKAAGYATYVVNRDELGKSVATTIQLAHER